MVDLASTTHLACEGFVEEDVPGCQVSVHEGFLGEVAHAGRYLLGKAQEEVLKLV